MTRLFNDPSAFAEDAKAGFCDAFAAYVVDVPGGVVRRRRTRAGKVAVVVGGGSGHYPAFAGIVGPGYADGAVMGNVFTSPSAAEAAAVGRAASGGAGVLLTTGNYAGDVLNFGLAVERLEAEGIPARYVAVTDDVASVGKGADGRRRGIAGDVPVFKCASAAAEEGMSLDEVVRVAEKTNERTRTLGVAFGGCTLPGAEGPLFTVPEGRMSVGLGIHGEAGIEEVDLPSAAELARTLVEGVLGDAPEGVGVEGARVTALLNGLGNTKYEELFVVWKDVARLLGERGLVVVEPEVGELVTSLDMAGCSLTLTWLDEELERLWAAPADTPAYRKGRLVQGAQEAEDADGEDGSAGAVRSDDEAAADAEAPPLSAGPADEGSRAAGAVVADALAAIADRMAQAEDELGRIDAVAGDGDHGRGMVRGSAAARDAARAAVDAGAGAGTVLQAAGDEWAARAGGTSGVLWGELLGALARRVGDDAAPDAAAVAAGVRAGYERLGELGGAKPGDKTMLDALGPFCDALDTGVAEGQRLREAWARAADRAARAADETKDLTPKVGRARPLAERSKGTPDAGAVSLGMVAQVVAGVLADR
ncbi:dihydroxyacetone kinase family protein [Quadrisphaera oryzae]|uniref:dihydroxyacetone kinase family protein n=1 Tax=Quadrisphaera TaxID=317661 RepID=UPI0016471D55|nr:dihydroxyacetone kinase family protein [Quadrisphaera sp. RL12-1S]MBC3760240.1 dihydroxyacetone kinase family protein [Quadrisphaera sp. RL12-1S]